MGKFTKGKPIKAKRVKVTALRKLSDKRKQKKRNTRTPFE